MRLPDQAEPVKDFTKPSIERALELALQERDELKALAQTLLTERDVATLKTDDMAIKRNIWKSKAETLEQERDEAREAARDIYNMRNWTFQESVAHKKRWPWLIED